MFLTVEWRDSICPCLNWPLLFISKAHGIKAYGILYWLVWFWPHTLLITNNSLLWKNLCQSVQRWRREGVNEKKQKLLQSFCVILEHSNRIKQLVEISETQLSSYLRKTKLMLLFKAMSAIFIKFLFFHQMIALQKLWKMLFISSKKLFSFSRYSIFCISVIPPFSTCGPSL